MIFLTVGTHEPFDRLVQVVDTWCAEAGQGVKVFGQIASSGAQAYLPRHFKWVSKLSPSDYREAFAQARVVVTHAGMGAIITALTARKPIIVLPRRGHLQETRNDHQWATAQQLKGRPGIFVAETEAELPKLLTDIVSLDRVVEDIEVSPFADPRLITAIREVIESDT